MMNFNIPSTQIVAAEHAISEGLGHFLLVLFQLNIEDELPKCIPLFHQAIELLLKDYLGKTRVPMRTMIYDEKLPWDDEEREIVRWLNNRRNSFIHAGEISIEDKKDTTEKLWICSSLAMDLYLRLGFDPERVFSPIERILLNSSKSEWEQTIWEDFNWQYIAEALANQAINNDYDELETSISIANQACDIAFRGLAKSWRIEGWDELSITEMAEELNCLEDEYGRCWWWNESDPYSTETWRDMDNKWFAIPMKVEDLSKYPRPYKSLYEVAKCYAVEIREMVKAFTEKTPYLDLEECVYRNWGYIMAEFLLRCPEAEVPPIDFEEMPKWHFYNGTISLQLIRGFQFSGWSEQQTEIFKGILSRIFGKDVSTLNIEFQYGLFGY
jgi:hypothetical protein